MASKKTGKPVGRPPAFSSVEEIQGKIDAYFASPPTRTCYTPEGKSYEKPILTITGLSLALGFCDRKSFYEYEGKPAFTHTIKQARHRIEHDYELQLRDTGGAGVIFGLKNLGWKDKQTTEHTGDGGGPVVLWGEERTK